MRRIRLHGSTPLEGSLLKVHLFRRTNTLTGEATLVILIFASLLINNQTT